MTAAKLYRVMEEIDYIDSILSNSVLFSLDKDAAVAHAKEYFLKISSTLRNDRNDRPNLMEHKENFAFMLQSRRSFGHMSHCVWVEECNLDEEVLRKKQNIVWKPSLDDAKKAFRTDLATLFMMDLNTTLREEELLELEAIFMENPESFRDGQHSGIVKHSSELLRLMKAEKVEENMMEIEDKVK